jgi:outer membrane protein OmpA-like peptidoglycan-associated protein
MVETAPGSGQYENAEDENGDPITTTTDAEGNYSFPNLKPGRYGVSFGGTSGNSLPTASSDGYEALGNQIVDIIVGGGAVEVGQDAFFVDPSGVVYDIETLAPIAGAKVTLYFDNAPVPDSWLNVDLGHPNGSLTGPDGAYAYLFDPATAQSGVYTIVVEKTGYKPSEVNPANPQPVEPGLGGGLEKIVADDVPGLTTPRTYYMALRVQFTPGNPGLTSNGIVNNHIPMDLELLPLVEEEVVSILKDDLAMTMAQQGRIMEGFSKGALDRLKSRDGNRCVALVEKTLRHDMIAFEAASATITPDSVDVLDRIATLLLDCPTVRFEVGGHLAAFVEDGVALSLQRAEAVVAALETRGISAGRLVAQGYGTTRPLADPASAKGRAVNERISFTALKDLADEDCRDSSTADRSFNASANDKGATMNGGFNREDRRCSDDSWRIVEGSASYSETGTGVGQMMFNVSIRRERFTSDNHVSGRFVGAYGSSSTVTGLGEGTILGFGLNAGIYGANRIGREIYFDYYLGAAGGRHSFDLAFDRAGGGVTATGAYSYGAIFAGAALSGQTEALGLNLSPRAGINLAWSPGGSGTIRAVRGAVSDASDLTIPAVMGARIFAEVAFEKLLSENGMDLSFTPRVLCDQALGEETGGCGYGASVELSQTSESTGRTYALGVEVEKVGDRSQASLSLRYKWPLGKGVLDGGLDVSTSGEASVQSQFKVEF